MRRGSRGSARIWRHRRVLGRKNRDLHVVIDTIPHSQQRYPTVGDWQVDKAGSLHITVSRMSDQRYEFLVGMPEAIEAYLAIHAGVSPEAVDRFDRVYEAKRKSGDDAKARFPWQQMNSSASPQRGSFFGIAEPDHLTTDGARRIADNIADITPADFRDEARRLFQ